ncbi:hypothetical protein B0J12DRAFT_733457 [Macrophomina phaseolina]|uniref:3-hydroxyacyl-CoA dehydrogenase n=1 Tax=Macrophomina phaseolina TaxID=35725 RepID=A0ABQ8FUG9_9PEZI|nr:hypothetical protein B0J12DRAFT_733457 [Macrophomina phaseolina]
MSTTWSAPDSYESRPVAVLGGGVLGRRIACCWASAGYTVHIRDPSPQQREDALAYVRDNVVSYAQVTGCENPGSVFAFEDLPRTVANAWLVFEAVPERLPIKIDTFADLETHAPEDAILCSNSSSYKSSEMLDKVSDATKKRILNTHYMMPPNNRLVELMTDGHTEPAIFPFLVERHKEAGLKPFVAMRESTGFIFNRVWAAIKREFMMILDEGVSTPTQLDEVWKTMYGTPEGPCGAMDDVGLDTVAFIEEHYIRERGLPSSHLEYLKRNYVSQGKLGVKCSKGGFYQHAHDTTAASKSDRPGILVLDLGLSQPLNGVKNYAEISTRGRVLEISPDGKTVKTLVSGQRLPDGVVLHAPSQRLFWTNMGNPSADDGHIMSSKRDGSDVKMVVPPGRIHTPKQIALDLASDKLYISDREGLRVHRCNLDGSDLETVIETGDPENKEHRADHMRWCVGIAVSPNLGKFFWTQKGASKGGEGRIFCADIAMPAGGTAATRTDVRCLLEGLPEPVDLEYDEASGCLFWTDRGEVPFGNTLNKLRVGPSPDDVRGDSEHEIIAQNFDEAIGLKVDVTTGSYYVADIGGTIWRCGPQCEKEKVYEDKNCAFSGLDLVR